jgi:hypothetical protein
MGNRNNTFLLKRSSVTGKVPSPGDLLLGEMALNTADVILYTSGTTANEVRPIGWDRIYRTGDTMNGDFIINGNLTVTGDTVGFNDRQILDIYESGTTVSVGTTYSDIPWDSSVVVDSDYTHVGSEITFNTTGYYEVNYSITIGVSGGGRKTSRCRLVIDTGGGYGEILRTGGSGYHRNTSQGVDSISKTIRQAFTSGDKIKVQFSKLSGTGNLVTIAGDSNITINKIPSE